jgi:hypothetical protein
MCLGLSDSLSVSAVILLHSTLELVLSCPSVVLNYSTFDPVLDSNATTGVPILLLPSEDYSLISHLFGRRWSYLAAILEFDS